jgi:hypothetical protein
VRRSVEALTDWRRDDAGNGGSNINRERVVEAGEEKDFEVVQDADYDAGRLEIKWNINVHPALPNIKFGFIILGVEEEDDSY